METLTKKTTRAFSYYNIAKTNNNIYLYSGEEIAA